MRQCEVRLLRSGPLHSSDPTLRWSACWRLAAELRALGQLEMARSLEIHIERAVRRACDIALLPAAEMQPFRSAFRATPIRRNGERDE